MTTGEPRRRTRKRAEPRRRAFLVLREGAEGEPVVLRDSVAVHALADPLRLEILRRLAEPRSAKELAAELDRPVTSLYHHLDLLEASGVIGVVDVERHGRTSVRRYARLGERFELRGELAGLDDVLRRLDPERGERAVRLRRGIASAVRTALDDGEADRDPGGSPPGRFRMLVRAPIDPGRVDELGQRLHDVIAEFIDESGGVPFDVVVTVGPAGDDTDVETRR